MTFGIKHLALFTGFLLVNIGQGLVYPEEDIPSAEDLLKAMEIVDQPAESNLRGGKNSTAPDKTEEGNVERELSHPCYGLFSARCYNYFFDKPFESFGGSRVTLKVWGEGVSVDEVVEYDTQNVVSFSADVSSTAFARATCHSSEGLYSSIHLWEGEKSASKYFALNPLEPSRFGKVHLEIRCNGRLVRVRKKIATCRSLGD